MTNVKADMTLLLQGVVRYYNEHVDFISSYDDVDDLYAYLGYDLELEPVLQRLGIHCTSDLLELLFKE